MRRRRTSREPQPMSEETKALLAENRKAKQDADTEDRVAKMAAAALAPNTWCRDILRRYTARVLELAGRDRLEFMESHPISSVFR